MPMYRLLLLPSAIGQSHLTRLLLLAQVLRDQGHTVAVAFRDPVEPLLQQAGFPVWPVADAEVTTFQENVYAAFDPALITRCVQDELQAIAAFQPQAIIADFRLTAAISARLAHLPYVTLVNAPLTAAFNPVTALARPDAEGRPATLARYAARTLQNNQQRALVRHFRAVARRSGVSGLTTLCDFLAGDLTLIADLPQWCPLDPLPAQHHLVGPFIWEGLHPRRCIRLDPDPTRLRIYATAGNTGHADLLSCVINAFGNDNAYQVVVTTGAYIDPAGLPPAANVHATRFLPGSQVMPHAHLVIHCGGSGTTYQTLTAGCPALVVPFNNEQRISARLVQQHGVGHRLAAAQLTPARLRTAVAQVLADDALRAQARQFQVLLRDVDGPRTAADLITTLLATRAS